MTQTILALDTATEACSVALTHLGKVTHLDELSPRTHTQRILPMIDELLAKANISLQEVDYLAFGVRVGIGVAQGLAFGAELQVLAISNLMAMAEQVYQTEGATNVIALIDARMNEVYFAQYQRTEQGWQELVPEQVCAPEKAIEQFMLEENPTVVGTGWQAYSQFSEEKRPLVVSEITLPSAQYMLELAKIAIAQGKVQQAMEIEPVYLRNEVTWQKLPHKQ